MAYYHSAYSFKYGLLRAEEVVRHAQEGEQRVLVVADINSSAGILPIARLAQKTGIPFVPGVDVRHRNARMAVILALNVEGYAAMNAWVSARNGSETRIPFFEGTVVIYPLECAKSILQPRENEYFGVAPWEIWKWRQSTAQQKRKAIAWSAYTLPEAKDWTAHKLLRAMGLNTLIAKLDLNQCCDPRELVLTRQEWVLAYDGAHALMAATDSVLNQAQFYMPFDEEAVSANQQSFTGSLAKDKALLRGLCISGLAYRYPKANKAAMERIDHELSVIETMGFVSYFLINWDIVRFSEGQGYFHVGRGSGANSIVSYLLKITNVDPLELDLYFERFIHVFRKTPPDFDIDFSWKDRPQVTKYIFSRFPNTALLGAYSTFQYRAVVRELGKTLGLPKTELDRLAQGEKPQDDWGRAVLRYGYRLHGLPSHMTLHSSGILIAQNTLHQFSTTFMPPKGYPTVHFDMLAAEDVGLAKFDILGQRGLSKIQEAVEMIQENHPHKKALDIQDVRSFKVDPKVLQLLSTGGAMGCFYVESPAMRMLMQKLQTNSYLDLVAASSIIRPGVAQSGMMREYIHRHRNPERRNKAHPVLLAIMPDTYGVMVYQEDVIRVAHLYGGLTLAEADVLRRSMSGKFRSREEFQEVKDRFFDNGKVRNYPEEEVAEIWRQMESFAGYAFAKGHSASYAVESFQSLYLKAYYPIEYMAATINNGGGFYRKETYVQEARRCGAIIESPCVQQGSYWVKVRERHLFLGFFMIVGLSESLGRRITKERSVYGPFLGLDDFIRRLHIPGNPLGLEDTLLLVRANALRFTNIPKRTLLWEMHRRLGHRSPPSEFAVLFIEETKPFALPEQILLPEEEAFDQWELFGFPLCSPFSLLSERIESTVSPREWPRWIGKVVRSVGHTVSVKDTKTAQGAHMKFGTFLDPNGEVFDTVHFPPVVQKYPFRGHGIYAVTGRVSEEWGYTCLDVLSLQKLPMLSDPRYDDQPKGSRTQSPIQPESVPLG